MTARRSTVATDKESVNGPNLNGVILHLSGFCPLRLQANKWALAGEATKGL